MTEPCLALQGAVRSRLAADAGVLALVPALNILDRNTRPEIWPAIIIGEGQTVLETTIARNRVRVYLTIHIWAQEPGTTLSKSIAGAINAALQAPLGSFDANHCIDLWIASAHYMRDPVSTVSHGVVNVLALMEPAP